MVCVKLKKGEKILVITSEEPAKLVPNAPNLKIRVCREQVAALLSPQKIIEELKEADLRDIVLIVVPGGMNGDVKIVEETLGIPVRKGPLHIVDLATALESGVSLSTIIPADELLEQHKKNQIAHRLALARSLEQKIGAIVFGGPTRIIAEIVDAPKMGEEYTAKRAQYYAENGASAIDLGMIAGEDNHEKVQGLVGAVRSATPLPISIDALNEKELLAGVDAGVDLLLSLSWDSRELIDSIRSTPAVIIPREQNKTPKPYKQKIELLEKTLGYFFERGFSNVIADPILEPINFGFSESLAAYYHFRASHPGIPMLFGVGNVSELMDADSPGIHALLAAIASELDIQFILTPEYSNKARGSVRELATAANLMLLAKSNKTFPKNIGVDLLLLKEKKKKKTVELKTRKEFLATRKTVQYDKGSFKIFVSSDVIRVVYEEGDETTGFAGDNARDLSNTIVEQVGGRLSPAHLAYLGRELAKAEICLTLGKNYVQDEPVFKGCKK